MSADFDRYRGTYTAEVDRSLAFARTDAAFFAELKAVDLVALAERHLPRTRSASVLDFGCGTGELDRLVAGNFGRLHGVDVSQALLEEAARANPEVEYRHYDGTRLPYEDGSFDLAFAVCVFHHIDPGARAGAAEELRRVVRPGGIVAVYEHNPLNPLTRLAVSRCEFDEGVELLPLAETKTLLRRARLEPVEARYIAFIPWRGGPLRTLERCLARVPLGGQHVVVSVRREPR